MRTSLFLSSLFAVSLIGGVALAEGSRAASHAPPSLQSGRTHGDTVDKVYKAYAGPVVERTSARAATAEPVPHTSTKAPSVQRANSRVNCSLDAADCVAAHARQVNHAAPAGAATRATTKNPLESKSDERVSCNEADECSASSKGTKAIWAKSRQGASPNDVTPISTQAMASANRKMNQAPAARMECNDADECNMPSKEAGKLWATEAVKHGTFSGVSVKDQQAGANKALKEEMSKAKYENAK